MAEPPRITSMAWHDRPIWERLEVAEARVARLEAALQWLRVHATNPDWTTLDGALALVNAIEVALAEDET